MVDNFAYVAYAEYFLIIFMFGYAAFWAFSIRRALSVGLYRGQASGTGLVAAIVAVVVTIVAGDVFGNQFVITLSTLVLIVVVFNFVDTSVAVARRSDPFLRDTLRWTRLRKYFWGLVLVLDAVSGLAGVVLPESALYGSLEGIVINSTVFVVTLAIGAIAVPLSALRSGDLTLRVHFRWFGAFLIFLLLFVVVVAPAPPINFLGVTGFSLFVVADFEAAFVFMFMAAYCLYRCARSLVPLNRLTVAVPGT